jgi:hypothetical protein
MVQIFVLVECPMIPSQDFDDFIKRITNLPGLQALNVQGSFLFQRDHYIWEMAALRAFRYIIIARL